MDIFNPQSDPGAFILTTSGMSAAATNNNFFITYNLYVIKAKLKLNPKTHK